MKNLKNNGSLITLLITVLSLLISCTPDDEYYGAGTPFVEPEGDSIPIPLTQGSNAVTVDLEIKASNNAGIYIWITDASGAHVNTITWYKAYELYNDDVPHEWINDGGVKVDGVTKATRWQTMRYNDSFTWNRERLDGTEAPDGDYKIKIIITKHDGSTETNEFYEQAISVGGTEQSAKSIKTDNGDLKSGVITWHPKK